MDDCKIHSRNATAWICTHYTTDGAVEEFSVPYMVEIAPVQIEGENDDDVIFSATALPGIFVCRKEDVIWYPIHKVNI
jgi:hypothetical protein